MSGILQSFAYGRAFTSPPVNVTAPVVAGTATVGQTLSSSTGTWTGLPTPTYTYQWQRVTTNISGATSSTYVLVSADAGSTIRCVVTATNSAGSASSNSNSTASVAASVPGAPTIGTATATGSSSATITYTAPASNGGATITSYTAISSPGSITGILSTAGSGTITVSGLSAATSYTFVVYATNSVGNSANSGSSNSITTSAAYWVVWTGNGNGTTNNPIYSNAQGFESGNSYGYNVTPSGYSILNIYATGQGTFAVLNPSGVRVNGYVASPTTETGNYLTVRAVGQSQANSNYAIVAGGNSRACIWDAASGSVVAPYNLSNLNFTVSSALTSSNELIIAFSAFDPKSGDSTLAIQRSTTSGYRQTDFNQPSAGRWDNLSHTAALRTDGTGVVVSYGSGGHEVWLMNSTFTTVSNSKKVVGTGINNGPVRVLCVDASNNIYYSGDIGFSAVGRVVKVNSGLTAATNFIFDSGDFSSGGMAIYGNYLYGMKNVGGTGYAIGAFNLTTLTLDWNKRFNIPSGSTTYAAGKQSTLYVNSTGIYFGMFAGSGAGYGTFSFKIPLDGAVTNGTYAISGASSIVVSDYPQGVTSAALTLSALTIPSTTTGSGATPASPAYVTSSSILPTSTRTLFA